MQVYLQQIGEIYKCISLKVRYNENSLMCLRKI